MKNYVTIYEFIGGLCIMSWCKGYIDPESDSLVKLYMRYAEISLDDLAKIRKIYKYQHSTIGSQYAIWNFVY